MTFFKMLNGDLVQINTLLEETSFDVYQSDLHYSLCETISKSLTLKPDEYKTIVNILAVKSLFVKQLSATLCFISNHQKEIQSLTADEKTIRTLRKVISPSFEIFENQKKSLPLVPRSHAVKCVLKALLHRAFRFFSSPTIHNQSIIRAWVDVSEKMFADDFPRSSIRIFPFNINVIRQIRFIKNCKAKSYSYSLDGLPYSLSKSLLSIFLKDELRLKKIAEFENSANLTYAHELLKLHPQRVLTSDEFEVASHLMYSYLIENGIKVTNCAHGVGLYCPYTAYSEYLYLTKNQGEFYRSRFCEMRISHQKTNPTSIRALTPPLQNARVAFVLIHQNFQAHNLKAEENILLAISKITKEASKQKGIPFFIKMHPNSKQKDIELAKSKLGGIPILQWVEIKNYRLVAVLINSTTFFDLKETMPVLIYKENTFTPELYFEHLSNTFNLTNLNAKLSELTQIDVWNLKLAAQIQNVKEEEQ